MPIGEFTCIVCSSKDDFTLVHDKVKGDDAGKYKAVQCHQCGHIQLNPAEYSLDYYNEDGQVNAVVRNYGTPMAVLVEHSWIEARRRVQRFHDRGISLSADHGPMSVLDVGGGYGFFAAELMRSHPHIDVKVVEPSQARVELGQKYLRDRGPDIPMPDFLVELIDEDFVERHRGRYDIVTMWHVLEHIKDPVGFLRLVNQLVKPGTGIVCIEVPNAQDELMTLSTGFKDRWFMTEHLSYFTPALLENVTRRAGHHGPVNVYGYQRYGLFNYFHWIHFNKPQGANPDLFEGTDRWWLEASWRAAREAARTSDALLMVTRH